MTARWTFVAGAAALFWAPLVAAQTLIVGNKGEDTVSFFSYATGAELARLPTGPAPHEVAVSPDGATAVVVAYGGAQVDVYDVAARAHAKTIDVAPHLRPHGLVYLADGRHLLATTEGSRELILIDAPAGKVVAAMATGARGSHMVAVTPDNTCAFVADIRSNKIAVFDLAAQAKVAEVDVGPTPEGIAVTPDGRELWAASQGDNAVAIFDTESLKRLGAVPTGATPIRVAISPDGRHAVTSNFADGTLTVIEMATRRVLNTTALTAGGPDPKAQPVTLLFHPSGERLFVAVTGENKIAELKFPETMVMRRFAAGASSDGLGYSPVGGR